MTAFHPHPGLRLARAALAALALLLAQGAAASGLTGAEIISTVAGTGVPGNSGDGGPAIAARLQARGVAADERGNVYIADHQNHVVRRIDPAGNISLVAGNGSGAFAGDGGPATQAALQNPIAVAVDGQGNVYIADRGNNRIRKVAAATGLISTFAGVGGFSGFAGDGGPAVQARLGYPFGLAATREGVLYIADTDNQRLRRVRLDGVIETIAGDGQQLVTGPAGDGGPALQASFGNPTDVALDAFGNIYVADVARAAVRRINSSGTISNYAGRGPSTAEGAPATQFQFGVPWNVAVDAFGNVYVSDASSSASRVFKIDVASGAVNTVAGSGSVPGFGGDGGMARNARLRGNFGIAFDPAGSLYIADMGNSRLRKVSAPVQQADLSVTKTCSPARADIGQSVTCTITVTNAGPGTAVNVQLTDTVATTASVSLQSVTPAASCPVATPLLVSCNLGALAPGASATVVAVLSSSSNGTVSDTATVSSAQPDPVQANNSAGFTTTIGQGRADLQVVKEPASGSVRVGQEASFFIRVVNHGPDAANDVRIVDIGGAAFARVLPQPGWSCTQPTAQQANCGLASLAAGASSPRVAVTMATSAEGQVCNAAVSVSAVQEDPVAANNVVANVCVGVARAFALNEFVAFSAEFTAVGRGSNLRSGALGTNLRRGSSSGSQVETFVRGPLTLSPSSFVLGETVRLDNAQGAVVRANDPVQLAGGATTGSVQPAGSLPILALPALQAANPESAASGDVSVASEQTRTLEPGRYRNVSVGAYATLYLRGYSRLAVPPGTHSGYDFTRLTLGKGAKVLFLEPSGQLNPGFFRWGVTVRIASRLRAGSISYIGPSDPQGQLRARNIMFHVGGTDVVGITPALSQLAVAFLQGAEVRANVLAPNGSILFDPETKGVGAFVGKRIAAERVDWTLDSAF